jgi:DNA-binding MarR family transcriptional regulator
MAEKTYKDKVSIKKLIDNLEKRKLVYRTIDETDKRIKRVHLTEKGRELIPALREISQNSFEEGFAGIDESDIKTFKKVLSEIVKNFTGEDLLKFININKTRWK